MDQLKIDIAQQAWIVKIADENPPCLHIGCGLKKILGACNIDYNTDDGRLSPDLYVDAHELDKHFGAGSFASVVSSHVLPATSDPVMVLRQCAYVLRPGGIMGHVVPDLRYAPARKDAGRRFEYQPWGWRGPDEFAPIMARVADLFDVIELASFNEFDWSFKVLARRRDNA